jgi:hypothetical protein
MKEKDKTIELLQEKYNRLSNLYKIARLNSISTYGRFGDTKDHNTGANL